MKKHLLIFSILLLCNTSFSQRITDWLTVYEDTAYPEHHKAEISFNVTNCAGNDNHIVGYSHYMTRTNFNVEGAYVEVSFDYTECDGTPGTENLKIDLGEPKVYATSGMHFLGVTVKNVHRVRPPYFPPIKSAPSDVTSSNNSTSSGSSNSQSSSSIYTEKQKQEWLDAHDDLNKGLEEDRKAAEKKHQEEQNKKVLADQAEKQRQLQVEQQRKIEQQNQNQTQTYLNTAQTSTTAISKQMNVSLAELNALKQGGATAEQQQQIQATQKQLDQETAKATSDFVEGTANLLGVIFNNKNKSNHEQKAEWKKERMDDLNNAANNGDAEAMETLGIYIAVDEKNEKKAAEWYQKAADLGNAKAMFNLSTYYKFYSNPKDEKLAAFWLEKAANYGYPNAMEEYGRMLTGYDDPGHSDNYKPCDSMVKGVVYFLALEKLNFKDIFPYSTAWALETIADTYVICGDINFSDEINLKTALSYYDKCILVNNKSYSRHDKKRVLEKKINAENKLTKLEESQKATNLTKITIGQSKTLPDGLKYEVLEVGSGNTTPLPTDQVEVNYIMTLENGTEMDNSYKRNEPFYFYPNTKDTILGFSEAVRLMRVGDKFKVVIPSNLGYGNKAVGEIPPNSNLVFIIKLEKIN